MERRLIQHRPHGPSEMPAVHTALLSPEHVKLSVQEKLNPLGYEIGLPIVKDAVVMAENKEAREKRISKNFEDIPIHANAIANGYAQILPPERQKTILHGVTGDTLRGELEGIMEAITTVVQTGEGDAIEHRYLRGKESPKGLPAWYAIDFHKVEADKQIVAGIKAAHPELAGELSAVENALNEYARVDPSLPMDRWGLIHANEGDKQALQIGKLAAIIIAASAAVLTGVLALGRKEGYMAPLLYAGVAGLLISPDLRRSIFGSKAENVLAQVNRTVNAQSFKENASAYHVAGPEWRAFADTLMQSPAETKNFLKALARHPVDSPHNRELIDEYVNGTMPKGPGREELRRMIMEKKFPSFAGRLMSARNNDVRDVVLDYIGSGAERFAGMAKKSAEEATELFKQQPRTYMSGSFTS